MCVIWFRYKPANRVATMKKYKIFIIICALLTTCAAFGSGDTKYTKLVKKVSAKPTANIMNIADRYAAKGKDGEALVLYAIVYNRFDPNAADKEKDMCALARKKAGTLYYDKGNYINALDEFINGVKISEACSKPTYAASLYNYIGNIYCIFLDYEKGIRYYLKAYDLSKKYPDRKMQHSVLVNLTGMYSYYIKDIPKAKKYYQLSESTRDKNNKTDTFMSLYTLSLIQISEGDIKPAISRLKWLAGYAAKEKLEPRFRCFAYQEIYSAYRQLGVKDSTLKYMHLCDRTAQKYNLQHTFVTTTKSLSDFFQEKGDIAMSNLYKSRYLDIMDSIYDMRKFDMVKNSLLNYEIYKTTKEIEDLRTSQHERMQTIRMQWVIMCAVAVVALTTILFLFIVWKQKKRIHKGYINLYKINRDFIETQELLTSRLRKCRTEISEKNDIIDSLRQELGNAKDTEESTAEEGMKYQTSNLTDGQMQTIADAIGNVMENTTEFCDCNFSLSRLADLVGSNRSYVSQVINDSFQKTFNDYVTPYRIHLACKRLTDRVNYGNFTMKAIAESVGFKSYTAFVNAFKKITGITPSIYQKIALDNNSKE